MWVEGYGAGTRGKGRGFRGQSVEGLGEGSKCTAFGHIGDDLLHVCFEFLPHLGVMVPRPYNLGVGPSLTAMLDYGEWWREGGRGDQMRNMAGSKHTAHLATHALEQLHHLVLGLDLGYSTEAERYVVEEERLLRILRGGGDWKKAEGGRDGMS